MNVNPLIEQIEGEIDREQRRLQAWQWLDDLGLVSGLPTQLKMVYLVYLDRRNVRRQLIMYWDGLTPGSWRKISGYQTITATWSLEINSLVAAKAIPVKVTMYGVDPMVSHQNPAYPE